MNCKLYKTVVAAFLSCCIVSGCAGTVSPTAGSASSSKETLSRETETQALSGNLLLQEDLFTSRDKEVGYVAADAISITLNGDQITCDNANVSVEGTVVTIKGAGTYLISGTLNSGQIIVDAGKEDKLQIVLAGADITCDTSAPLYIKQADKVVVTLDNSTENRLSVRSDYVAIDDNSIDAVLFSKEDVTLNGSGSLKITANYGSGIVSKDDVVITGGTYEITAAEHAIAGKDNVKISDGTFTLTAGKDGIHSENKDDTTLGFIYIGNGTFDIKTQGDGMDAAAALQVDNGNLSIVSGSGNEGTIDEEVSSKGLKAGGDLTVQGGVFRLDCTDDAVHSNSNVQIGGGTFTILTGDDGIHADASASIREGEITIEKSYEGIEGKSIDISGGKISLRASDDGLNAAGGNDGSGMGPRPGSPDSFQTDGDTYIHISGGNILIDAGGDGVDSNGSITVSGGETYVNGPVGNGNSALDYDGTGTITGGIFLAAGPSGMAQSFGEDSTQGTILFGLESNITGGFTLKNSSEEILTQWTPSKQYGSILISLPTVAQGQTYTLTTDGGDQEITMETLQYSNGIGGGMGGRGGMGGHGGGRQGMAPPENGMTPPPEAETTSSGTSSQI